MAERKQLLLASRFIRTGHEGISNAPDFVLSFKRVAYLCSFLNGAGTFVRGVPPLLKEILDDYQGS